MKWFAAVSFNPDVHIPTRIPAIMKTGKECSSDARRLVFDASMLILV